MYKTAFLHASYTCSVRVLPHEFRHAIQPHSTGLSFTLQSVSCQGHSIETAVLQIMSKLLQAVNLGVLIIIDFTSVFDTRRSRHSVAASAADLPSRRHRASMVSVVSRRSDAVRDLGIYIDADLTMRTHVPRTVSWFFAVIRHSRQIRRHLSPAMLHTLVVALVLSRLDGLWQRRTGRPTCLPVYLVRRLQSVYLMRLHGWSFSYTSLRPHLTDGFPAYTG